MATSSQSGKQPLNKELITIAIDAMGGDHGPLVVVPAALQQLSSTPHLSLILVGDEPTVKTQLKKFGNYPADRVQIKHTTEVVAMDEAPASALRSKKDSSMRQAIQLVKDGKASACVSAGNTGALMATARFVLKTLPGVDRPAIISQMPTFTGQTVMLDLGANVDSTVKQLVQFGVMGSVYAQALTQTKSPRVGLLNIGTEDIKGNELVKQTAQAFSELDIINYAGFIEADELYLGKIDVIVCDGFVGNIALKTSEGLAHLFGMYMKNAFTKNWLTKLLAIPTRYVLREVKQKLNPDDKNGASFIGLQGVVVKSHGRADIDSFGCAIQNALIEVEQKVQQQVEHSLPKILVNLDGDDK